MEVYHAGEGKIFAVKADGTRLGTVLYLAKGDSIENYIEVEMEDRAEKEALLRQLLAELYPPEEE